MKFANLAGRAVIVTSNVAVDVETASGGRFPADPHAVLGRWTEFRRWAGDLRERGDRPIVESELGAPSPRPAQVFGIGLNYRAHAAEAGLPVPRPRPCSPSSRRASPGPHADVALPSAQRRLGGRARRGDRRSAPTESPESAAWDYVAGLTVGQDLSERVVQWAGGGQFSLGKSFPGFGPMGPWLVTPDEIRQPATISSSAARSTVRRCRRAARPTWCSASRASSPSCRRSCPLLPGDVIFTGTPEGVGATRKPPRFLKVGEVLTSYVEGVGTLRNRLVAAPAAR